MKQIIICTIVIVIATKATSQHTQHHQTYTREYYLIKSQTQKSAAWVLLGGGSALVIGGLFYNQSSLDNAATGATVGVISAIGSIPLFVASRRNKRKAAATSAFLKFEEVALTQQAGIRFNSYPAACIKINFSSKK